NARQSLKNLGGRNGGDNVNNNDDTTQTFNFTLNPYTMHHFGNYADSTFGYRFSQVVNTSSDTNNSAGHNLYYTLDSGSRFVVMPWSIAANFNKVDYDDGGDNSKTYHLEGNSSYVLSRIWSIDGYGFYDKYDFDTNSSNDEGFGGGAGLTWTPSNRTRFKIAYGYRVLTGWNLYFDLSHRRKRSTFTASLTHDVQTSRSEQLNTPVFDDNGNPIFDPDAPDITNDEHYIHDRLRFGYTLQGNRNTLNLSAYASRREGETSNDKQDSYGAGASWNHSLTPQLQSTAGIRWDRAKYDYQTKNNDTSDNDTWTFSAGLTHALGPHTNISLNLRHLTRTADDKRDEYDENRISLALSTNWN
ncbi:MAG TPA: DUF560 domain-containing protein, partial [Methylothermaceae bacterium]|nr:DUF560 domain-containing protein [Methylothermaceae bacterium]